MTETHERELIQLRALLASALGMRVDSNDAMLEEVKAVRAERDRFRGLVDHWRDGHDYAIKREDRHRMIAMDLEAELAALRASAVVLPEDWRGRLGECESSGAAVDLVESWLGTVEAAPPHGPDAAPAVIPTFEMVAWCEIHDADARSCACPEGAYEERHRDCATADGVCIERHVGVSGTGTEASNVE